MAVKCIRCADKVLPLFLGRGKNSMHGCVGVEVLTPSKSDLLFIYNIAIYNRLYIVQMWSVHKNTCSRECPLP